jgi:transposase
MILKPRGRRKNVERRHEVTLRQLDQIHRRLEGQNLDKADWAVVSSIVAEFRDKHAKRQEQQIARQREAEAESPPATADASEESDGPDGDHEALKDPEPDPPKPKGGGRRGAKDYRRAKHIHHPAECQAGSPCPACGAGRMYRSRPRVVVRFDGQPAFSAEVHHIDVLRCRLCNFEICGKPPDRIDRACGNLYYSACAMLAVLHYWMGMPFKRLESLQEKLRIPLADATQWDAVDDMDGKLMPLFKALERYAMNHGRSMRPDDTGMRVVSLGKEIRAEMEAAEDPDKVRRGVNGTALYFETDGSPIILYYTGLHHAGEVTDRIGKLRVVPGKMAKVSDAASKNFDHGQQDKFEEGACNTHALRRFKDQAEIRPDLMAFPLKIYGEVYRADAYAKRKGFSPDQRLALHRQLSLPRMEKLLAWCKGQIELGWVEPNSQLWEPLTFVINQYPKLTRFCHVAGMPLDTNFVEQVIKALIRYRNNSRAYQTETGAEVGDRMMSLIQTAIAAGADPVAYLEWCLDHHVDLKIHPELYFASEYCRQTAAAKAS